MDPSIFLSTDTSSLQPQPVTFHSEVQGTQVLFKGKTEAVCSLHAETVDAVAWALGARFWVLWLFQSPWLFIGGVCEGVLKSRTQPGSRTWRFRFWKFQKNLFRWFSFTPETGVPFRKHFIHLPIPPSLESLCHSAQLSCLLILTHSWPFDILTGSPKYHSFRGIRI